MYSITEAATRLGVSRSTLLYYERIGLIKPMRDPGNGYRRFSEVDLQHLSALLQLKAAGLSWQECQQCLAGQLPAATLDARLAAVETRLRELLRARDLLHTFSGANGNEQTRVWHDEFLQRSPRAYRHWLSEQGFSEQETLQIQWLSKDMNENQDYMRLFLELFVEMERQGPGDEQLTQAVMQQVCTGRGPEKILDMGCGTGIASLLISHLCNAQISALDNCQLFLDRLDATVMSEGLDDRVSVINGSMFEPPFPDHSFDLIWSEGSAYLMGFESALKRWQPLLNAQGYLFVSEMCWFTDQRSGEAVEYWQAGYPSMLTESEAIAKAQALGYQVVSQQRLPKAAWEHFYADMQDRIDQLEAKYGEQRALTDCRHEIDMYRRFGDEFGYLCLLLRV
ncbi:MerR family transcriptional regulator [Pontibacterium granulatum]|uniref:MerR family transcriptional regulator n=1 Tax=Pontibacterium granulatum TaxID=2036029 RepID=UPI00249B78EC|nr:MerR family transcriptional regulator [Pontibacterium granulatum]MDI3325916.1 MerR family transcriptional regulator [Pontibacterium granulatum]